MAADLAYKTLISSSATDHHHQHGCSAASAYRCSQVHGIASAWDHTIAPSMGCALPPQPSMLHYIGKMKPMKQQKAPCEPKVLEMPSNAVSTLVTAFTAALFVIPL